MNMPTAHTDTVADTSMLRDIASRAGTPSYVYDARVLDGAVRRWIEAVGEPSRISYAVKANFNLAVLASGTAFLHTRGKLKAFRYAEKSKELWSVAGPAPTEMVANSPSVSAPAWANSEGPSPGTTAQGELITAKQTRTRPNRWASAMP